MKFNRGLTLCVFLVITYTINISHVCSLEAKRRKNMMEFMNNFIKSDDNGKAAKENSESERSYSFKEMSRLRREEKKNNKKK